MPSDSALVATAWHLPTRIRPASLTSYAKSIPAGPGHAVYCGMRTSTSMARRLSRGRVWPVVGVAGADVRAVLLVGAVWLAQSAGPAGLRAAWGEPAAVGRDELRCDDDGCSLGACQTQTFWADPESVSKQARAVPRFVDGQPRGIQLFGLRPGTLLAQLGLLNGRRRRRSERQSADHSGDCGYRIYGM